MRTRLSRLELYRPDREPTEINSGKFGAVYRVSEDHAIKIPHSGNPFNITLKNDDKAIDEITREFNIAKDAYEGNVSVPDPYGIHRIKMGSKVSKLLGLADSYPGFLMKYIKGTNLLVIQEGDNPQIEDIFLKELEKARALGFYMAGDRCNAIWQPEEKKVYLLDFEDWSRK